MFYSVTSKVSCLKIKVCTLQILFSTVLHSIPLFWCISFYKLRALFNKMTTHPRWRKLAFQGFNALLTDNCQSCFYPNGLQGLQSPCLLLLSHTSLHPSTLMSLTLTLLDVKLSILYLWAFLLYPTHSKSWIWFSGAVLDSVFLYWNGRWRNSVAYFCNFCNPKHSSVIWKKKKEERKKKGKYGPLSESRCSRDWIIMVELLCAYIVSGSYMHAHVLFHLHLTIGLQIRNSQFYLRVILDWEKEMSKS